MTFNVVIVGGGPAGLFTGVVFANAGASVALIEKETYPRDKICAGILTSKTVSFLNEHIPSLNTEQFFSTNHLALFFKDHPAIHIPIKNPFTLVDRKQFDFELMKICKEFGVHILEGKKVITLNPNKNVIHLNDGQAVTYDFLVAADGVHSTIRKFLGVHGISSAFCIQSSFERRFCPESLADLQELQLYFGNIPLGYSWIVPNNKHILIGTGAFTNKFNWTQLQQKHDELCSKIFPANTSKYHGAHVPIGELLNQTDYYNENIIFVGDAAGLANPLTGEGIYYALLSGFLASQAYIADPERFKTTYLSLLQTTANKLKEEKRLLSSFYDNSMLENVFFQFKDYPEYLANVCDEVVSVEQRSYLSLFTELKRLFR